MIRAFLLALVTTLPVVAQDIVGDWIGTLHAGSANLRVLVHITRGTDGTLKADMDSLDQNAKAIPISSIELKENKLTFTSAAVHGSYNGTANAERTAIEGTFIQGAPLPLNFKRAGTVDLAAPRRPQNPMKPYPYREEDLIYESPAAGIKIGATLTMPNGRGPFPRSRIDHRFGPAGSRRERAGPQAVPGAGGPPDPQRLRGAAFRRSRHRQIGRGLR